jgi:hypothetical protein
MAENLVVSPPQLLARRNDPPLSAFWIFSFRPILPVPADFASQALNANVRALVAAAATRIVMPATPASVWASPKRLRSFLAPSLARRVQFVDQRENLWDAVVAYFAPMLEALHSGSAQVSADMIAIADIAWDVYLLMLAFKKGGELALDLERTRRLIATVSTRPPVSGEARARLAVIEGLFATYRETATIPGLRIHASADSSFGTRVDDIIHDAHFLEVSVLRRFFGVAQNRESVLRDIRKLVAFIVRHKPWATGIMSASTHHVTLAPGLSTIAAGALEAMSVSAKAAPILTDRINGTDISLVVGCRSVYNGNWESHVVRR